MSDSDARLRKWFVPVRMNAFRVLEEREKIHESFFFRLKEGRNVRGIDRCQRCTLMI